MYQFRFKEDSYVCIKLRDESLLFNFLMVRYNQNREFIILGVGTTLQDPISYVSTEIWGRKIEERVRISLAFGIANPQWETCISSVVELVSVNSVIVPKLCEVAQPHEQFNQRAYQYLSSRLDFSRFWHSQPTIRGLHQLCGRASVRDNSVIVLRLCEVPWPHEQFNQRAY